MTGLYVGTVIAAGALLLVETVPREYPNPTVAIGFSIAMLVVSVFKLRLPLRRGQSTMSMAYVIDFLVLVTAGADLAMAIAAIGVIAQCTLRVRVRQPWYRAAFSVATIAIAVQAAGWTWSALGGAAAGAGVATSVIALAAAAAMYFVVNTGFVAGAIALSGRLPALQCWRQNFLCTAPAYLVAGVGAAVLQLLVSSGQLVLLPAAGAPMLVGYLAYAHWFRQTGDRPLAPALTQLSGATRPELWRPARVLRSARARP
jgi:hypothetical protein